MIKIIKTGFIFATAAQHYVFLCTYRRIPHDYCKLRAAFYRKLTKAKRRSVTQFYANPFKGKINNFLSKVWVLNFAATTIDDLNKALTSTSFVHLN